MQAEQRLGLLEAVLQPQEVLYVPPVWFHATEARGPGPNLGLSYWSESETQTRLNVLRSQASAACKPPVRKAYPHPQPYPHMYTHINMHAHRVTSKPCLVLWL